MLIKLLKYEFLNNYKKFLTMSLSIVLAGSFAAWYKSNNTVITVPSFSDIGVAAFITLGIVLSIFMIIGDYKQSLFSSKGFLTNTLPVEKSQIITAKIISALFWMNLVIIASFIANLIYSELHFIDIAQWIINNRIASGKVEAQAVVIIAAVSIYIFMNVLLFWLFSHAFCFDAIHNICKNSFKFGEISFVITAAYMILQINIIDFLCKQIPLNVYLTSDTVSTNPIIKLFSIRDNFLLQFDFTILIGILFFSILTYIINAKLSKDNTTI